MNRDQTVVMITVVVIFALAYVLGRATTKPITVTIKEPVEKVVVKQDCPLPPTVIKWSNDRCANNEGTESYRMTYAASCANGAYFSEQFKE